MAQPPYSAYAQSEVLNASPERLVQLLYGFAIRSVRSARECNAARNIRGRVHHINKAFEALVELSNGLDFEAGGEIAVNYGRVYDYCQRRVLEANTKQSNEILAEVQSLLEDLSETWEIVMTRVESERAAKLLSPEILPSEEAVAGKVSCVG